MTKLSLKVDDLDVVKEFEIGVEIVLENKTRSSAKVWVGGILPEIAVELVPKSVEVIGGLQQKFLALAEEHKSNNNKNLDGDNKKIRQSR